MQQDGALEAEIIDLYQTYAAGLSRYACAVLNDGGLAEDLVQEAFLRFLAERTLGRVIHSPKAWLYRVLRNLALDRLRQAHRCNEIPVEEVEAKLTGGSSPQENYERREAIASITGVLTGRELECLRFRGEGLKYEEIGAILGLRTGTVGTLLARAYRKTREVLDRGPTPNSESHGAARVKTGLTCALRMASHW